MSFMGDISYSHGYEDGVNRMLTLASKYISSFENESSSVIVSAKELLTYLKHKANEMDYDSMIE